MNLFIQQHMLSAYSTQPCAGAGVNRRRDSPCPHRPCSLVKDKQITRHRQRNIPFQMVVSVHTGRGAERWNNTAKEECPLDVVRTCGEELS